LLLCDFEDDIVASPARIGVALPEFFGSVRAGESV
jgi:hypothetical protein